MGAQGAMFWLWRQQPAGQEMTHGAIMHSWNQPSANFDDIAGLGAELEKDSEWLSKLTVKKADVGILYDINNSNFLSIENSANEISYYKDWTYRFYLPLMKSGYQRDVINLTTPINSYKLLFIPLAPYLPSAYIAKLIDWVKKGNTLIVGPMTGYRTEEWAGQSQFGLGLLEKLCGFTTGARIPIGTQPRPAEELIRLTYTDTSLASPATARLWAEDYVNLTPLATYTNSILKDKIAIGSKKVGNGRVILLGTDPGTRTIERIIVGEARKLNLVPNCLPQSGIAHCMHTGSNGNGYLLAVNLSVEPRSMVLSKLWTNLDSKVSQTGNLILKPFEVVKLVQK